MARDGRIGTKRGKAASIREQMRLALRFLRYFRPHQRQLWLGFLLLLVSLLLSLAQPLLSRSIIDNALLQRNGASLHLLGVVFLAVALLGQIVSAARQYCFLVIQQKVIAAVRKDLSEHLLRLPMSFHDVQNSGYLLARVDADVGNLAGVMTDRYIQAGVDVLMLVGAAIILIVMNWRLALLSMSVLPVFMWAVVYFGERTRAVAWKNQEQHAQLAARLQEMFQATLIIKLFARELSEVRWLMRDLHRFVRTNMHAIRLSLICGVTIGSVAALAPLAVIWYGGYQVIRGELSVGSLFAFNMYLAYLFTPLRNIFSTAQSVQASSASLERVYELFDTPSEDSRGHLPSRSIASADAVRIELRNVCFGYRNGHDVLHNVSFSVPASATVALVGPSGAGKTSIFNLLLGLYEARAGEILFSGINLHDLTLHELRGQVRAVPQEAYLFNRSIVENVRFGAPHASAEDLLLACNRARVTDFVNQLPQRYDSVVGQRGTCLSGGEKQRLAIARALMSNPEILLLDEPTAFLDSNTEALIQEAITDAMRGRTCLIIAHRLHTVMNADSIVVIEAGRVIDQGTHEELYGRCALYTSLCDKQFRERDSGTALAAPPRHAECEFVGGETIV